MMKEHKTPLQLRRMLEHDAGIPKRLAEIIALDDYSHGKSLQEEPDPEE